MNVKASAKLLFDNPKKQGKKTVIGATGIIGLARRHGINEDLSSLQISVKKGSIVIGLNQEEIMSNYRTSQTKSLANI